jgi:hypothetical protein
MAMTGAALARSSRPPEGFTVMRNRTLIAIGIAALVAVGCTATGNLGASSSEPSAEVSSATPTPLPTSDTSTPGATPVVVTEEPTEVPEQAIDLKVVKSGFSRFKGPYDEEAQLGYGVIVENPSQSRAAWDVDLSIAFLDGSGDVIDTVDETFPVVLPGQRVAWADTLSDYEADWSGVKKMEVALAEPTWEAVEDFGEYSFTKLKMKRDMLKDIKVTGRLKSTFEKDLENPQIVAVFYRGSKIVGGGWTFLENARNNAPIEISTSYSGKASKVEVYGVLSNLSLYSE